MSDSSELRYCPSAFRYTRRITREVKAGDLGIGGNNPIRIQSMLTSDTRDTEACIREALALAEAGSELIRLTAQTRAYAENLEHISKGLRAAGCHVPLVADIHFKPDAAMEAAKWVEKIRINPGNFIDKKRTESSDFTEEEYAEELERLREAFTPLVLFCKEHGRAMRIGTNHGSLSDRIMNRFGDTPQGMVESALEFARLARELDYHNLVFSMKASNTKVMVEAYRLLTARLAAEGADWNYPIHLGVTEAGSGEDGRIKSAVGIGSLLSDGIGDTLRVSLTEDAVREIPVAYALAAPFQPENKSDTPAEEKSEPSLSYDPLHLTRRNPGIVLAWGCEIGWNQVPRVIVTKETMDALAPRLQNMGECLPELTLEKLEPVEIDPRDPEAVKSTEELIEPTVITVADGLDMEPIAAFRWLASVIEDRHPILLKDNLSGKALDNKETAALESARILGSLLCDGIGDALLLRNEADPEESVKLAYNIMQACGARIFKTEFISCPSCGRTLYPIQEAVARIQAATGHLKGLRIAVMGCIVNGPGEMADADFGYVGGAPGKINLYVKKTPVKFNIPQENAVEELVNLIKEHGKWIDPPTSQENSPS